MGQKFKEGYIVTAENDTLRGKLNIAVNSNVKFGQDGQTEKYKKLTLQDYGAIEDTRFISYYDKTAFSNVTRKGILYLHSGDSTPVFIYKQTAQKINFYNQQKEKEKALVLDIKGYKIISEKGEWQYYDCIAVPKSYKTLTGVKDKKQERKDVFFGRRLEQGVITLFSTLTTTTSFSSQIHSAPTMNSGYTAVYLLKKGDHTEIIPKNKWGLNSKTIIKSLVEDEPELAQKIGKKGYKVKNIKAIIKEYNLIKKGKKIMLLSCYKFEYSQQLNKF